MPQAAEYADFVLTMTLPVSIGPERLVATRTDWRRTLTARTMPPEVMKLLADLFRAEAIEKCVVTFGTRLELHLPRRSNGRQVLASQALVIFEQRFKDVTGRQLNATWQAASPTQPRGGNRSPLSGGRGRGGASRGGGFLQAVIKAIGDAID